MEPVQRGLSRRVCDFKVNCFGSNVYYIYISPLCLRRKEKKQTFDFLLCAWAFSLCVCAYFFGAGVTLIRYQRIQIDFRPICLNQTGDSRLVKKLPAACPCVCLSVCLSSCAELQQRGSLHKVNFNSR